MHGTECVRQWFCTAEPLAEHRMRIGIHTHTEWIFKHCLVNLLQPFTDALLHRPKVK